MTSTPSTSSGSAPVSQGTGGAASSPCVAGQPVDRLLKLPEVIAITGIGKTMIYRLIERGDFPRQHKPGGFASRWSEVEVRGWVERQRVTS